MRLLLHKARGFEPEHRDVLSVLEMSVARAASGFALRSPQMEAGPSYVSFGPADPANFSESNYYREVQFQVIIAWFTLLVGFVPGALWAGVWIDRTITPRPCGIESTCAARPGPAHHMGSVAGRFCRDPAG